MLVVALTRFGTGGTLETEVAALAPVLGSGAYELRLALVQTPPIVLVSTEDAARAKELVILLRGRGHGAVACDASSILSSESMFPAREFRFESEALWVEAPSFGNQTLPYSEILLFAEATHAREEEKSEEHAHKKLSLARSVLTGGLVNTKTVRTSSRQTSEEKERVLYVIRRGGAGHVLLREQRLRYTGLGSRIGRTVIENFGSLRAILRERAPTAPYDDRLLKSRKAASLQVSGTTSQKTVIRSNLNETDLAVHLLAVAELQGQR